MIKVLKLLYKSKHSHFISVDKKTYFRWKYLIKLVVYFNKNYKSCEIYRKKYKILENIVIVGLRNEGKNVKRRTSGFAKEFVSENKKSKCLYCECRLSLQNATTDHIVPISNKGNNCQVNLIVCCKNCNNERGNMPFMDYLRMKNPKYKDHKFIFI